MTDKIDGKLFEKNEIAGGNIFCQITFSFCFKICFFHYCSWEDRILKLYTLSNQSWNYNPKIKKCIKLLAKYENTKAVD